MMKKSKWLSIIAIVLVVACMATLFVGCKDKEKKPDPVEKVDVNAVFDKIINGYALTIGDEAAFSAFNFATSINVSAQEEGQAAKNYTVDFKLGLDLVNSLAEGKGDNGLVIDIKEGNNQVFYFNYKNNYGAGYEAYNSLAFMQVGDKKYNIKAINVAETVKAQFEKAGIAINPDTVTGTDEQGNPIYNNGNPYIDDDAIAEVAELIGGYIKMAAMAASNATMSDSACSFEINLGTLLDPSNEEGLGSLVAGFNDTAAPYLGALGIDLDLGDLADILPALAIKFDFSFDAAGKVSNAKAEIVIPAKQMVIKNTSGGNLIDITIPNKLTATVEVASLVVNGANFALPNSKFYDGKSINAIDLSLAAELKVNKAINMPNLVKLTETMGISLNIPAGTYTVTANASIDPTVLLGVDFVDESGAANMSSIITAIVGDKANGKKGAVDFISLAVVNKDSGAELLSLALDTKQDKIAVNLEGALGLDLSAINGASVSEAVNTIIGMLTPAAAPATADGDPDVSGLVPVGNALKNLQVVVNANGVDVNFGATKFALAYVDNGETKYNTDVFFLEVAATAKIDANGINITAKVKNGGTLVADADKFDIDVEVSLKFTDIKYGEAVRPTFD
ncbi:MAG: hypothetical protein ACI4MY_07090 [Christensenellales bacterium]